jgi:arylformamidase
MQQRIVDLTYPIHEGMTTFPAHWHPMVELSILGRLGIEARETRKIVIGTHTGTHCDAPRHFIAEGATIDQVPLETLVGPAVVVDLSATAPSASVGPDVLAAKLGDRRPERLLLRFDWSRHWGTLTYYTDHPFLSEDAAAWLVARGVKLLGMDTPMPDDPRNGRGTANDSPNHKTLLGNGVVLVEYLNNLAAIATESFELVVLPLKIVDGDGAPARCIAIENGAAA